MWFVKQVASHISVLFRILQFMHWKSQEDSYNWQIIQIFRYTLGLKLAKYPLLRLTQTWKTTECNVYVWKVLSYQRQVSLWQPVNNFSLSSDRASYCAASVPTVDCKLNPYLCFCDEIPGLYPLSHSACLRQLHKDDNHIAISSLFVQWNRYIFFVSKANSLQTMSNTKSCVFEFYLLPVNAGRMIL